MDAAAMSTKRKPISRPPRMQITPLAIALFKQMARIACTCAPHDRSGTYVRYEMCAGCKTWWDLHRQLHHELQCRPWQWPCIQSPTTECSDRPDLLGDQTWRPDEQAQRMWRMLERAAQEARRTEVTVTKEGATR
jgi:hypothetical protein